MCIGNRFIFYDFYPKVIEVFLILVNFIPESIGYHEVVRHWFQGLFTSLFHMAQCKTQNLKKKKKTCSLIVCLAVVIF